MSYPDRENKNALLCIAMNSYWLLSVLKITQP